MILNETYAYLVGKVMGDGHLEKRLGSCYFISGSKSDLERLSELIKKEFSLSERNIDYIKQSYNHGISFKIRIKNTNFCRELYLRGAPKGRKVETRFSVPSWIRKNKRYSKVFLQGILEDELTTIKIKRKNHANNPQFKMSKMPDLIESHKEFVSEIRSMILNFGLECGEIKVILSRKDAKTLCVYFHLQRNKKNILRFKKEIGFKLNEEKTRELDRCCSTITNSLRKPIDKNKIIILRKKGIKLREIASELNISIRTVIRILKKEKEKAT